MAERHRRSVVAYEPGLKDDVLRYLVTTYGPASRQASLDRFEWLYERCPYASPDIPQIWLSQHDDQIVGHFATIPFDLSVGQITYPMVWGVDYIVDERYRGKGRAAVLAMAVVDANPLGGALNLSNKGDAATTRLGFEGLGIVPVYCRPLDARALTTQFAVSDRVRRLAPLAQPLVKPSAPVAAAGARLARVRLEPTERFDSRVDEIWARSKRHYQALSVRDHEAIQWRIDDRPNRDDLRRFYLRHGRDALGYVVLRRTQRAKAATVVDYLCPPRWVAPLLTLASAEAQKQGAVALICKTHNRAADRYLRAAGFVRMQEAGASPVLFKLRATIKDVAPVISDIDNWFITAVDADLEPGLESGYPSGI